MLREDLLGGQIDDFQFRPVEAPFVLLAAFHAPRLIDKVMPAFPEGAVTIRTRSTIGREAVECTLGIPSIEKITGGKSWRPGGCWASIRRFASGRIAGMGGCNALFRRSGAPPGGIDPLRFCDNAIRFLG